MLWELLLIIVIIRSLRRLGTAIVDLGDSSDRKIVANGRGSVRSRRSKASRSQTAIVASSDSDLSPPGRFGESLKVTAHTSFDNLNPVGHSICTRPPPILSSTNMRTSATFIAAATTVASTLLLGSATLTLAAVDAQLEPDSASAAAESSTFAQLRAQERLGDRIDRLRGAGLWHDHKKLHDGSAAVDLSSSSSSAAAISVDRQQLTGRFIHVTDFHPDPHYRSGASLDEACHRKDPSRKKKKKHHKKKKGKGKHGGKGKGKMAFDREEEDEDEGDDDEDEDNEMDAATAAKQPKAGYWGTAISDCDAPMTLVNSTLSWLAQEWSDQVDFVVWTGDSARHDLDREVPRTPGEIYDLNRMMTRGLREAFGDKVVIVPSIGNNDIYRESIDVGECLRTGLTSNYLVSAHNIFAPGPNAVTNTFAE